MAERGRRWPWVVAAAAGTPFVVLTVASAAANPDIVDRVLTILLYPPAVVALLGVGALLVSRVPGNRVGAILLAAGVIMSLAVCFGVYAQVGVAQPGGPWPGTVLAALLNQLLFLYPLVLTLVLAPLYFPDGRLPGPRWRVLVALAIAVFAASNVADLFRPTTLVAEIPNPLGTEAMLPLIGVLDAFTALSSVIGFGGAAAAILVRYRRSTGVEREQLKWLMAVAGLGAIIIPASFLAPNELLANILFVGDLLLFAAFPIAIGIAILRYRLYDIDRLISRSIGWGIATGVLVAAFGGAVVALQAVLAGFTEGQTLAVAGSTLVAFAMFQPVRRRVQAAVDRRFDRSRYDGERTAAAFAERLRGQLDLSDLTGDVAGTVEAALRPSSSALWIRDMPREPGR